MPYNPGVVADGGKYILAGALSASKAIGDAIGDRLDEHRKKVEEADNLGGVYAHYFGNDPEKMGAFAQGSIGTKRALVTNALSDQIEAERKNQQAVTEAHYGQDLALRKQIADNQSGLAWYKATNPDQWEPPSSEVDAEAAHGRYPVHLNPKEVIYRDKSLTPTQVTLQNGATGVLDGNGRLKVIPDPRQPPKPSLAEQAAQENAQSDLKDAQNELRETGQTIDQNKAQITAGNQKWGPDWLPDWLTTPYAQQNTALEAKKKALQEKVKGLAVSASAPAAFYSSAPPARLPLGAPPLGAGDPAAPYRGMLPPPSAPAVAPAAEPMAAPAVPAVTQSGPPIPGKEYRNPTTGQRYRHNPDGSWTAL